MKIKTLQDACFELLAVGEVFRRLGFNSDDIYLGRYEVSEAAKPGVDGPLITRGDLFIELRRLIGKPFQVCVSNPERDREDWSDVLVKAINDWNAGRVHASRWEESEVKSRAAEMMLQMAERGWRFPCVPGTPLPLA